MYRLHVSNVIGVKEDNPVIMFFNLRIFRDHHQQQQQQQCHRGLLIFRQLPPSLPLAFMLLGSAKCVTATNSWRLKGAFCLSLIEARSKKYESQSSSSIGVESFFFHGFISFGVVYFALWEKFCWRWWAILFQQTSSYFCRSRTHMGLQKGEDIIRIMEFSIQELHSIRIENTSSRN